MRNKSKLLLAAVILLYLLIVLFSFGCMTPGRAVGYLKKHHLLADTCAANYPITTDTVVRERITHDTTVVPSPVHDTLIRCDSTVQGVPVKQVKLQCPPTLIIRDTVYRDTLINQRDPAEIAALYEKLEEKEGQIAALQTKVRTATDSQYALIDKRNWWMIACIITWAACAIYITWKLK